MTHPHEPKPTHLLLPVPFGATVNPGVRLWSSDLWVAGWDLEESTGAAGATVQLFDGGDATGVPLSPPYILGNGGRVFVQFGGHLLTARSGLFVAVTAGSVQGVVYAADKTP